MSFIQKLIAYLFRNYSNDTNSTTTTTTTTTTTGDVPVSTKKFSIHIGINDYKGTNNDLAGCVNDCKAWSQLLQSQYGFQTELLLNQQATYKNVREKLIQLVQQLPSDGHLVIQYSGHGTYVKDVNNDEENGKDEAWVLYDLYLIDDNFRNILDMAPEGAKITVLSDSCHSGTMTRSFLQAVYEYNQKDFIPKPKFLPPEDTLEAVALNALQPKTRVLNPNVSKNDILIAAAAESEYAYDSRFSGVPHGAFSYYAIEILKKFPQITYKDFFKKLNTYIPSRQYPQTPQLEGKEELLNNIMFS